MSGLRAQLRALTDGIVPFPFSDTQLNANENIYGAPQEVLDELRAADHGHFIYPDPTQLKLRTALAKLHDEHGVKVENVVAGAG